MAAENTLAAKPAKRVISREGSTDIHAKTAGSTAVKIILITISVLFLFVMLVMPLITVIYEAFRKGIVPYLETLSDPDTVSALLLTLEATIFAVVINTIFGLFAAWAISKFRFHGKKLLVTLIDLPVTVSPIIAGLIFVLTFGRQSALYPLLESIDFMVVYAVPGIILATVFVTFPFISREILPVLDAQGTDEEEAAALMGAKGFTIFRKVTLPHIKWALMYGIVLCAARAMGEFGAVSVLSGHLRGKTVTLPLQVEILFGDNKFMAAFAVSSILVVLAVVILIVRSIVEYIGKRRGEK